MIRVLSESNRYLVDLATLVRYVGTGTHGSTWDEPGGDLMPARLPSEGGVDQWSDLRFLDPSIQPHPGLPPFQDYVAMCLSGTLIRWPASFDYDLVNGTTRVDRRDHSDVEGTLAYKARWSQHHFDRTPSNLLSSLLLITNRPKFAEALLGDSDTVHYNGAGTYRVRANPHESLRYTLSTASLLLGLNAFPGISVSSDWQGICAPRILPNAWMSGSDDDPTTGYVSDYDDGHIAAGDALHACSVLGQLTGFSAEWVAPGIRTRWSLREFTHRLYGEELIVDYTYSSSYEQYAKRVSGTWNVRWRTYIVTRDTPPLPPTRELRVRGIRSRSVYTYRLTSGRFDVMDRDGIWYPTAMHPYSSSIIGLDPVVDSDLPHSRIEERTFITSAPYSSSDMMSRAGVDVLSVKVREDMNAHGRYWYDRTRDLQAAYFFAYQDAIASVTSYLKTNYIQTLSKIGGVVELVPDGRLLITALAELYRRDPRGIIHLGDFIASEHLKWNFGTAPNARSLAELNRQSPVLRKVFAQGLKTKTRIAQGVFSYAFATDESKYDHSTLSVHAKTSLTYSPTPFMQVMLDLYGIGILPTMSRIWEIIPFSFVADWFTHAKDRIKVLDTSILQLCFQHNWSIFSMMVRSDLSSVCGSYRDCNNPDEVSLIFYDRALTQRTPAVYNGRYDFLRVAQDPNLGILSALIYSLSR